MKITVDAAFNARIQKGIVYYPMTNAMEWAIIDPLHSCVIGFEGDEGPFHCAGGHKAIHDIVVGTDNAQGLVEGCTVIGFVCEHCVDDIYRLKCAEAA